MAGIGRTFVYRFAKPQLCRMLLLAAVTGGGAAAFGQQKIESMTSDRAPVRAAPAKASATLINDPAQRGNAWPAAATSILAQLDLAPYEAEDALNDATPGMPYRVGVNRPLPKIATPAADGHWRVQADGVVTWTLKFTSPGAQALSLHIADFNLPDGTQLVIRGSGQLPPISYQGLGPKEKSEFWTRVTMGDTVYVEYQDPTGQGLRPSIVIDEVSHIYRGTQIAQGGGGQRGVLSCQQDVNCHSVDATARDAVGRMLFQDGGFFVCSGALLNDADPNTFAGYFLTANHCISSQAVADTLQVWWFYDTNSCNGTASIGAISNGAQLLATSPNTDFTLLRMDDDPGAGQGFAGWTTAAPGGTVRGIHHPGGSFKRFSEGPVTTGSPICNPNFPLSRFVYNDWSTGITEGGSSGSPLFNTSWQVVGQLYGICFFQFPACGGSGPSNPQNYNNLYGRFAVTFPSIAGFLNTVTPDDAFEDNDSLAQAPELAPGAHNLRLVDFDDYFTVTACAPMTISATATFSTGAMDLDLFLLDSGGGVLDSSTGAGGSETVSAGVGAGSYRIRADKFSGWGGDYTLTLTISGFPDCNTNGTPDACEPDCNSNGTPDECEITAMPGVDCNSNNLPDDCDIASGFSHDCDTSGVPDECETDCNNNGFHDSCDIAGATSADCNANAIPDDCEVDCDGSGTIDECEIAAGTSPDADSNGVPDVCQRVFVDFSQLSNPEDGASWSTAFTDLQSGLQRAGAIQQTGVGVPTEVWVAQGTYFPDIGPGITPNDRAATFQLINGVELYGGFAGGETDLSQRDINSNATILSGDIDSDATLANNSYHVVTGTSTDNSAVIDGFTIREGNANGAGGGTSLDRGGGMFNESGSPTVRNCVFSGNFALSGGAGMSNGDSVTSASPIVTGCTFIQNISNDDGGGVISRNSAPSFGDCLFQQNQGNVTDINGGGGGLAINGGSATVTNCIFVQNSGSGTRGGGLSFESGASVAVDGCTFRSNTAQQGGGLYINGPVTLVNSDFISNSSSGEGGGCYNSGSNSMIADCRFIMNSASSEGGALYNTGAGAVTLTDCTLVSNSAFVHGGAVYSTTGGGLTVTQCMLVGNSAGGQGGAINLFNSAGPSTVQRSYFLGNTALVDGGGIRNGGAELLVQDTLLIGNTAAQDDGGAYQGVGGQFHNCSIVANHANSEAGGMWASDVSALNCIFWGNTAVASLSVDAAQFSTFAIAPTIRHSVIQDDDPNDGSIPFGGAAAGNIDDDPQFVGGPSGTWTANATTHGLGKTRLTDSNANGGQGFVENELVGKFLNPNTNGVLQTLITSNGPTTIVTWGDFTTEGTIGATYQINDYRLGELSPAIDAGEPTLVFELLGEWKLDENSGTLAADGSGNGQDGTLNGSVTWSSGQFGSALSFDSSLDFVEIQPSSALNSSGSFSIAFWVNAPPNQAGGPTQNLAALIDKSHGAIDSAGWVVQTPSNVGDSVVFAAGDGTGFPGPMAEIFGALTNSWHHVAFTVSSGADLEVKGYLDGALVDTATIIGSSFVNNQRPLLFGRYWNGGPGERQFEGLLDEIRIYQGVLSSGEIQAIVAGSGIPAGSVDLDGNERLVDVPWLPLPGDTTVRVDMGAYEHQPDCNSNGVTDDIDIASNGSPDCNSNSVIDSCDIQFAISMDIDADGNPDDCDDPMFASVWTDGDALNSSWDDIDNWLPLRRPDNTPSNGMTPAIFYDVTIGQPGGFTVDGSTNGVTIVSLTIVSTSGVNTLSLAQNLTANQSVLIGTNGEVDLGVDTVQLSSPQVTIDAGGTLRTSGIAGNSMVLGGDVDNSGTITKGANQFLTLTGSTFANRAGGVVSAQPGAGITVQATDLTQLGQMNISSDVTAAFTGAELVNSNGASISLVGSTLFCPLGFRNEAGATVSGAAGTIDGTIVNAGVITSAGDLTLDGDLTILPGGSVQVTGDFAVTGSVLDFNFLLNGGSMALNPGAGNIGLLQGNSLTVNDAGTFMSEGATDVTLTGDIIVSALGSFEQSGPSDGMIMGNNMMIGSPDGIGGRIVLDHNVSAVVGAVSLVPSPCSQTGLRGCSPPELQVLGNSLLDVSGPLSIGAGAQVQVSSTLPVEVGGNFLNDLQDANAFDWTAGGMLLNGVGAQTVEVAGQDVGPAITGFLINYGFGRLEVDNATGVTLVDLSDNDNAGQSACTEALYVSVLTLRAGSQLNLDNVRVYYGRLVDQGGTVNLIGCAQLLNVPTGDFDGDGDVDTVDYGTFADCMAGPNTVPVPVTTTSQQCLDVFDFDGDSDVDAQDFGEFSQVFSP